METAAPSTRPFGPETTRPSGCFEDVVLADPLVALELVIDQLGSVDLAARVGDEILELDRLRARLEAQVSRRLGEFDRRLEHTIWRFGSAAAWLGAAGRVASDDAHRRVRVARHMHELDASRVAWEAGEISTRHVESIVRARQAARANDEFAEFEPAVVELAKADRPEAVVALLARWREALDADRQSADPAADCTEAQHERRGLHASTTIDGMVVVDGLLDPANGSMVTTALDAAMGDERVPDDPRTLPQLRADALTAICEGYLSHREPGTNLPHVVIQTDLETLADRGYGLATTEHGVRLSAETLRRLACDSIVQAVLSDWSIPINLGRSVRTFSPAQKRAMGLRDRGCRYPGCDRPVARCRGHHIDYWGRDDGPTDLDNGCLLCRYHHRLVHEGRVVIRKPNDPGDPGALDFYDRNDRHIGRTRPRAPDPPLRSREQARVAEETRRARQRLYDLVGACAA